MAAGSVMTKDVEGFSLFLRCPVKFKCDVGDIDSRIEKGKKYYPWMCHFDRGMPWKDVGYDEWVKNK